MTNIFSIGFAIQILICLIPVLPANDEERSEFLVANVQESSSLSAVCTNGALKINVMDRECMTYWECIDGKYELRLCSLGTSFNPIEKTCDTNYVCTNAPVLQEMVTSSGTINPNCSLGEIHVDPEECSAYWVCTTVNETSRLVKQICPDAQRFNLRLKACVPGVCYNGDVSAVSSTTNALPTATATAPLCEESGSLTGFRADNLDSRRYYQCAQGRWVHMDCPVGLVWNRKALVCDWPKKTICSTKTKCS